jgi:hypothetical protein
MEFGIVSEVLVTKREDGKYLVKRFDIWREEIPKGTNTLTLHFDESVVNEESDNAMDAIARARGYSRCVSNCHGVTLSPEVADELLSLHFPPA